MIQLGVKHSGENVTQLFIGNLELWFSYKTVVAFKHNGVLRVSENLWGAITGKHLNWIDGGKKEIRMKRKDFEDELDNMLIYHRFGDK